MAAGEICSETRPKTKGGISSAIPTLLGEKQSHHCCSTSHNTKSYFTLKFAADDEFVSELRLIIFQRICFMIFFSLCKKRGIILMVTNRIGDVLE